MTASNSGWRWATLLAGVIALWLSYGLNGAPYIPNDGTQYLEAASNLASGQCFCTRVAMFDEQVAVGHFPIPFTHFAPAYPLLIGAVSRAAVTGPTAGYLLSAVGFLAVLWLMQDVALALGARSWVASAFSLVWITSATALFYAASVGPETLFAALLLGLVALIVRDIRSEGSSPILPTGIGVLAGLSYWLRYPGLFLVGGAGLYLIARYWRFPHARRGAITGLLGAAILAGSIQVRNAIDTGSWRGGFNTGGHAPRTVVIETILSFVHLVTGDRVPLHFNIRMAIFLIAAALVLFCGISAWMSKDSRPKENIEPLAWALFIGFVYTGGVMLAAIITLANDLPRYYFPVYPLLLACAAVACSAITYGFKSLAVVLLVLAAIGVEAPNLFVRPAPPDWIYTRGVLAEEVQPGTSLLEWLKKQVEPDEVLLAVEGQAVHYVLKSPVIAVIPSGETARRTDGPAFRSLMIQFRSRYLLVFPNAPEGRFREQNSYAFLRSLAAGDAPVWLKLAARTRDAAVYECPACVN